MRGIVMNNKVSSDLALRAIRDLYARDKNRGDWPNGVPGSFVAIAGALGIGVETGWVLSVESYVRLRATEIAAGMGDVFACDKW